MADTGVLPFVRGIDFTKNDFNNDRFPYHVTEMVGLRWLRLNRTQLDVVPYELQNLKKLESLSLNRNNLRDIHTDICNLPNLRILYCRHNKLKNDGVPQDLFNLEDLSVIDLGHNQLKEIPAGLENAKNLLVLNLNHNNIESIPNPLFINLTDLIYLDLGNNKLDTLPPQMRRLVNLKCLILNNNPLTHANLRQLPSLSTLELLHMSNTARTINNFPASFESLSNLADLDLSFNGFPSVPESIYRIRTLVRLNISDNEITDLSTMIEFWSQLEYLNVSRNKLSELPASLCKLSNLRKLYANSNNIDFNGIPAGIGKLHSLEIFSAANNNLEMIPEGVCRCGRLKKLILTGNKLITLPDAIHFLTDLELLDVNDNPNLVFPPKPPELIKGSGIEYYNIDFSLSHQLQLAGAAPPPTTEETPSLIFFSWKRDVHARMKRLRKRRDTDETDESAKVLKGMQDVAKDKGRIDPGGAANGEPIKGKKWDENLERPNLNYCDLFDEDVGQVEGISCWEMDNFLPNLLSEALHGKFYDADCYIVLKTTIDEKSNYQWSIWFWIGQNASLDKKAAAAIHAVHLRNFLGAECRTIREEQDDESDEFLDLFENGLLYIEGGRTTCGFFTVEETVHQNRLYKVSEQLTLTLDACPLEVQTLDHRHVFIVDCGKIIYVWMGRKSKLMIRSKARLIAEKMNKNERKGQTEVVGVNQGLEEAEFWEIFGGPPLSPIMESSYDVHAIMPPPVLYRVGLGMGYLELPQGMYVCVFELPHGILEQSVLDTKGVFILDCYTDVFIWIGRKSSRLERAAALKLSQEIHALIKRPSYAGVTRCLEKTELQTFKSKFKGWDDVIPVDYTRTSESVIRRGADLKVIMERDKIKVDLSALFMSRQPAMTIEEADQLMQEWNDDLDGMESFVLEGKKFVRLPEEEKGQFYTQDCYVFLCRYWVPAEPAGDPKKSAANGNEDDAINEEEEEDEEELEDDFKCVVYFWQGRDAGNMGWLTFTFSLQKKFEALFGDKLEVVRTHQQQENIKLLSHFKYKFMIHQGKRKQTQLDENGKLPVTMYHLRANGSPLTLRCIQIPATASNLNSAFCYLLKVPFNSDDQQGIVYVWIGKRASHEDAKSAEDMAESIFGSTHSIQILNEGEEPDNFFWIGIGGRKKYETDADYMQYARLFRCSNEKGYFSVSEKCSDFCQDDLADEDVMILDNGEQVFLWVGRKTSDVEIKLAFKSAQVYIQHMRNKQSDQPRKLLLALKYMEKPNFTRL
ncbi:hypothetical protein HELRODRAFT_96186 [Helobdella robusta]|uniref:HP domain-containing protein n=1 Tax=Helobdella robusta TaxID=6412 RepID=T1G9A6_HELRO|nr:hypothetical protein HELRODRAFT_96186 [Helobdella robusta]ESN93094.1 hypothetical protein HELRODRAFT_96186 [Helobdella robusta]